MIVDNITLTVDDHKKRASYLSCLIVVIFITFAILPIFLWYSCKLQLKGAKFDGVIICVKESL